VKIALAADFHLDMRQFNNTRRWNDFLETFTKVTNEVENRSVDAYVIAGDIFHKYRPHPGIIRRFLKEISNLSCPTILIRGNHDSPQLFFEKFGGDTLHLIDDVSSTVYLNKKNPIHEIGDTSFIGIGYVGFNIANEIEKIVAETIQVSSAETKIGIFHQLLDYPGVPESNADISRFFLRSLGFNIILMGHYHNAYRDGNLFNPGSPEYWAFDQAEQTSLNLDTDEEDSKPAKKRGFFIVDTVKSQGEFVELQPKRPMFCVTYTTESFNERVHIPRIKEHLEKFNIEGAMLKTIIYGKHRLGRVGLSKNLHLTKPLIHNTAIMLTPFREQLEKIDSITAQTEYLVERGIEKTEARKLAEWLEKNRDKLSSLRSHEIVTALREVLG
jgi:DNA repair exonuclease SbcCD nuclease subunit